MSNIVGRRYKVYSHSRTAWCTGVVIWVKDGCALLVTEPTHIRFCTIRETTSILDVPSSILGKYIGQKYAMRDFSELTPCFKYYPYTSLFTKLYPLGVLKNNMWEVAY